MSSKPQSIDACFATVPEPQRSTLEALRREIQAIAPQAVECVSYGVPGFKLRGRLLVSFGSAAKHCAIYPGAQPVVEHAEALNGYSTSKGTVRFAVDKPLPRGLVHQPVSTRLREHAESALGRRPGGWGLRAERGLAPRGS